ncbi:DUF992 domain-containing protein [Mesorhizobium sp. M1396]|uniref:DUF992 domain-containing protein n=1 Tax=unclassified Mesorhizobium TaxID=325217 RepID=UPI00333BC3D6
MFLSRRLPARQSPISVRLPEFGIDVGEIKAAKLAWLVFAPANRNESALSDTYAGVSADAATGRGLGAKVLVGGEHGTISLQPISLEEDQGFNIAVGITSLTVGQPTDHSGWLGTCLRRDRSSGKLWALGAGAQVRPLTRLPPRSCHYAAPRTQVLNKSDEEEAMTTITPTEALARALKRARAERRRHFAVAAICGVAAMTGMATLLLVPPPSLGTLAGLVLVAGWLQFIEAATSRDTGSR